MYPPREFIKPDGTVNEDNFSPDDWILDGDEMDLLPIKTKKVSRGTRKTVRRDGAEKSDKKNAVCYCRAKTLGRKNNPNKKKRK